MATAFGAKRPKIKRGVEDIARMTPEERRDMYADIERAYLRQVLDIQETVATGKRFQADAAAAERRRALPLPFAGGGPSGGWAEGAGAGLPIRVDQGGAGVPVAGVPQYADRPSLATAGKEDRLLGPMINERLGQTGGSLYTLPFSGDPTTRPGLPTGHGRFNAPALPQSGVDVESGAISSGGAPPSGEPDRGGFDPKMMAMILASVSDAVKENLTLQGARGAKGQSAERLLQMEETAAKNTREDMRFKFEVSKWQTEEPGRQVKLFTDFANLAVTVAKMTAAESPEKQKVAQAGLEQLAKQGGMPTSWIPDYQAQGLAAMESIASLTRHIDPSYLQLMIPQASSLLREGKFQETMQKAANLGMRREIAERFPQAMAFLDSLPAYKGQDKPEGVVIDFLAGPDTAIRDYLAGVTAPKDEHQARQKRWAGLGVAIPETAGEIKTAVEKQKAMLPVELEKAEALEALKRKWTGTAALTPEQVGALRDDYTKASTAFVTVRDAWARMQNSAGRGTAAADLSMIYSYIKLLDPGSVVREGELALAGQTSGVPDRILNLYNKLTEGQTTLTATQRANFLEEGRGLFKEQLLSQLDTERDFRSIATKRGTDPDEAVPPSIIGRFRDADKKAVVKPERLSRTSETYKAARAKGFTDAQIEKQFNIKLTD